MRYQLVKYEGVDSRGKAKKETIVRESSDCDELYAERDELDYMPASLTAVRHGVRPMLQEARAAIA